MKSLPARPSLESLRKQAKSLARDIAAGNDEANARARAILPNASTSFTRRNAQFVIAREYGFAGWHDLVAEVEKRLGSNLEWAIAEARRVIHVNDVDRLKSLLVEFPALISWRGNNADSSLLGFATDSFGDSFDPAREQQFTRPECAELLVDAGAVVTPSVIESIIASRARGLLQLFRRKGLLPSTLTVFSALGNIDEVRAWLRDNPQDLNAVNEAFMRACAFEHEAIASVLLERCIALESELGRKIDGNGGRPAFIRSLMANRSHFFEPNSFPQPWPTFVIQQVMRTVQDGNLAMFESALRRDTWLLGENSVDFQIRIIEVATMRNRQEFVVALLEQAPALLRLVPPPKSKAFEFALTYARTHLIPVLARVWPLPDDLPHAAGTGNLKRVKQWFDESGAPVFGDLENHFPFNSQTLMDYQWTDSREQQILDTALAWAVINRHFDVADFLLGNGANINTRWGSHEPASILHELVGQVSTGENSGNYDSMQYLIDRGIDLTMKDYRWNSTASGWAFYAAKDEKMAQWLEEAERKRWNEAVQHPS